MTDRARRRELRDAARLRPPEAGVYALELEVLETVVVSADADSRRLADDLATLEALWREKLGA